ncbi:hypothetical protein FRC04_007152 [Tulasnella sp. 424]|nr:hypothetical protein FRC04_007152 [Tulasnella sp. 424]
MGSHQSRHHEKDEARGWPLRQKQNQARQSAGQSPSPTPTRSIFDLSTTALGLAKDRGSSPIQKAPAPSFVPKLEVLHTNPSTVSLQSKATKASTRSSSPLGKLFKSLSNRSERPGESSSEQQTPSRSGAELVRSETVSPGPVQRPKSARPGRARRDEEVPGINVKAPENQPAKRRSRFAVFSHFSGSRKASPARKEDRPATGAAVNTHHQYEPLVVSPPSPVPPHLVNKMQCVPTPAATQVPVVGRVSQLEDEGSESAVNLASPFLEPPSLSRRPSFFEKIDRAFNSRFRPKVASATSSLRSAPSANSLITLAAPSVSSYTTEQGETAPVALRRRRMSDPRLRPGISLDELRDGLLSNRGERSAKLNAMDCTRRLTGRSVVRGSGGYSDVWQAKLGGRLVAVKALRSTQTDRPDEIRMRKRLGRELHVWAALHHPHILELLGFAFDNGRPCLISPWCEYGTLQDYLKKYPNPDRRMLVRQIAEGLSYLHSRSPPVIHGDFKTMNILVTNEHVAKICDFGGSKHLGEEKTGLTTAGLPFGTVRYSAPEISREDAPQTLQSDIYSFGYVALETMTDKYPFWRVRNDSAVIHKVGWEGQTPAREDYLELGDEALWAILQRCWNYEPSARPTMIEVCRKLAAAGYGPSYPFLLC